MKSQEIRRMRERSVAGLASRYRALGPRQLTAIAERFGLEPSVTEVIRLNTFVLPFRTNHHVLENLIDWASPMDDPVFRLVFPLPGALKGRDVEKIRSAEANGNTQVLIDAVRDIRSGLNPHPSGQMDQNVPTLDGGTVSGIQHKYAQTVLYFPQQGQTCHAYCSYCFRWPQFVGDDELRFAASSPTELVRYLAVHPSVSDVLVTGGDPMMMSTALLRQHIEPLLHVESLRTIRIGTKALAFWPYRFTTDPDADDFLRLIQQVRASGKQVALMHHVSASQELEPTATGHAAQRLRDAGALMFGQAPLMAGVNDDDLAWRRTWNKELSLGITPYYMFVARDTGAYGLYKVPLARAKAIFDDAYRELPGLARTVRGPVMSATPGKLLIDHVQPDPRGVRVRLRFEQARDARLVGRHVETVGPSDAAWLSDLSPVPGTPADLIRACWPQQLVAVPQ